MWSILMAVFGWIASRFFNAQKDRRIEKKYVEARKIEIETKAENIMLKQKEVQRQAWEKEKADWEKATDEEKRAILNRTFTKRP